MSSSAENSQTEIFTANVSAKDAPHAGSACAAKPKAYLIDGSGYIFRAFYAVAPLTNKQGLPTNALFGFTRMLIKLLAMPDAQHVAMVFDAGRETFRNQLYPQYKANRDAPPEELVPQFPFFREIASTMGLPVLELPGYEADDVIGTLTKRLASNGIETVVVTADKDLMQLVGGPVTLWDTMRDRRTGVAEVREKFGVDPDKVVEVLGLIGDDSDNIPGVAGVGPKTAAQLIERYGSVEAVLNSVENIRADSSLRNRSKIADQLLANPEIARLSRKLVEIDCDSPVVIHRENGRDAVNLSDVSDNELMHALERRAPKSPELRALFDRLDFGSLLKDVSSLAPAAAADYSADPNYQAIYRDQFASWVNEIRAQPSFAFDLETTSLDPLSAKVVGASFCWCDTTEPWAEQSAYYVPLAHQLDACSAAQISYTEFAKALATIFADSKVIKVGQNLKYDISVLASQSPALPVHGVGFDTMIASYVINPDKSSHGLTTLAQDFLQRSVIEFDDLVPKGQDFSVVTVGTTASPGPALRYAGQDAHFAWALFHILAPKLKELELESVFNTIEMPLIPVLSRMELGGVALDSDLLAKLSEEFGCRLAQLQFQIFSLCGGEFNLNSTKQLAEVLFVKLGVSTKGLKKTKTGISTDSSVLEKLSSQHPVPALILEYRSLHKLKSTYVDALPAQVSPVTGRLHSRFNQTITGTGRLSSSDPNLQNIPIATFEGRRIRQAFIAPPGKLLLSADYSQVELRILAHMSNDASLISAFQDGTDIHAKTAREILGLAPDDQLTSEQRRIGKTINFGIIYGMSGFRLGNELGIPVERANRYIDGYFDRYPGVKEFFAKLELDITERGEVATLFGRKRFVAGIDVSGRDRGFLVRAALNAPLQGTAADLIKLVMIAIDARIERQNLPLRMILQIHDELLFECDQGVIEEMRELVQQMMESVAVLKVPLRVDTGCGANWQEAHA